MTLGEGAGVGVNTGVAVGEGDDVGDDVGTDVGVEVGVGAEVGVEAGIGVEAGPDVEAGTGLAGGGKSGTGKVCWPFTLIVVIREINIARPSRPVMMTIMTNSAPSTSRFAGCFEWM